MKLSLKYLTVGILLAMCGCAVRIDIDEHSVHSSAYRQDIFVCIDKTLTEPERDRAFSLFKAVRKFGDVSYDCKNDEALRVTRFDFGLRPITAHCGAQLLTTLSLGLIPSMCKLSLGGTFCIEEKTKEECFGPRFYQAEGMQGLVVLPMYFFSSWTNPDNAEVLALRSMVEENLDKIALLSKLTR